MATSITVSNWSELVSTVSWTTTPNLTTSDNNRTASATGYRPSFRFPVRGDNHSPYEIFRIVFLSAALVTSSVGNGFVLWASGQNVAQRRYARLHTLLVSLALSDLLQGPCQVMPHLVETILKSWDIGDSICKIHALTRSMLANISVSTLSLITLERFLNVESIDGNANLTVYACAVVIVWVLQAALASPMAVWTLVVTYGPMRKCHVPFSNLPKTLDYTVAVRVIAFFCPLGILWIGNLGVIYKLRRMDRKILPLSAGVTMNALRKRRSRKVTLTCLMLAIVFTVNLTPFQCVLLITQTGTTAQARAAINSMSYIWLLTVLNGCVNPFIYGFFFQNLKRRMLQNCSCLRKSDSSSGPFNLPKGATNLSTSPNLTRSSSRAVPATALSDSTTTSRLEPQQPQQQQQQQQYHQRYHLTPNLSSKKDDHRKLVPGVPRLAPNRNCPPDDSFSDEAPQTEISLTDFRSDGRI